MTRLATEGSNLVSGVHRDGVSIAVPRRMSPTLRGPLVMLAGGMPFRSDLLRVDSAGRRVTGALDGWPQCTQSGHADDAMCVVTDARRSTLWRIDGSGATRIGALPLFHSESGYGDGRWAGASPMDGELLVVDPASRRGLRVALPDSGYVTVVQPLRDGAGVLSVHGGAMALVLYRIDEPARATLARP